MAYRILLADDHKLLIDGLHNFSTTAVISK